MFNFTDISIVVVAGIAVVIGIVALTRNPFRMSEEDYLNRVNQYMTDAEMHDNC